MAKKVKNMQYAVHGMYYISCKKRLNCFIGFAGRLEEKRKWKTINNNFPFLSVLFCFQVLKYDCFTNRGCGYDDDCGIEETCVKEGFTSRGFRCAGKKHFSWTLFLFLWFLHSYLVKRSIFQTFWKDDCCAKFLFLECRDFKFWLTSVT